MNEVTRERIWRKLQVLPDEQLYEVLDYIEFIEQKYAAGRARRPDSIQRFAERLEDGMRIRSVAPRVISGTVGVLGTARRMIRTVTDAGRDLIDDVTAPPASAAAGAADRAAEPARQLPPAGESAAEGVSGPGGGATGPSGGAP
jgi:hypothetical protein